MRTSRFLTFGLSCALVCAAFSSCNDDKFIISGNVAVNPAVSAVGATVSDSGISFDFQGGEVVLPLSMVTNAPDADVEYTYSAVSDADWCKVSVSSDELTVTADPSTVLAVRDATIDISVVCSDKSAALVPLSVNVSQAALVISASPEAGTPQSVKGAAVDGTSVKFEYQGGEAVIPVSISSNAPDAPVTYSLSMKSEADWIAASFENGVLTVSAEPTADKEVKTAEIEIAVKCSEASAKVESLKFAVSQDAFASAMDMVLVNAGTFKFGYGKKHEVATAHDVTVSRSYYIATTETTQKLYEEVMGKNPSYSKFVGDSYPVNKMSWSDACEFCNRLSEREGLTPVYTKGDIVTVDDGWSMYNVQDYIYDPATVADGYRLPTAAEWEYAAKGGAEGAADPFIYAGSDDLSEVGWYNNNSQIDKTQSLHETAKLKANQLGIYDMSGNVAEWCYDWAYKYKDDMISSDPQTDPVGPGVSRNGGKIIRGGYYSGADYKTETNDIDGQYQCAGETRSTTGFRVVRTVKQN